MKKCIEKAYDKISLADTELRMKYISGSEHRRIVLETLEKLYNKGVGVGKRHGRRNDPMYCSKAIRTSLGMS